MRKGRDVLSVPRPGQEASVAGFTTSPTVAMNPMGGLLMGVQGDHSRRGPVGVRPHSYTIRRWSRHLGLIRYPGGLDPWGHNSRVEMAGSASKGG